MKKYFYLCLITLGCMLTFSACGSNDDDPTLEDIERAAEQGDADIAATLQDNGNELVIFYTSSIGSYKATAKGVYTFDGSSDDSQCIKAILTETYPSAEIAKAVFDLEDEEDKINGTVKLNGKQVIIDFTNDFKGMPKAEIKKYLEEEIKYLQEEMNHNH